MESIADTSYHGENGLCVARGQSAEESTSISFLKRANISGQEVRMRFMLYVSQLGPNIGIFFQASPIVGAAHYLQSGRTFWALYISSLSAGRSSLDSCLLSIPPIRALLSQPPVYNTRPAIIMRIIISDFFSPNW